MTQVLELDNIIVGLAPEPREAVIRRCGDLLFKAGYATERYAEGMLARDKLASSAIGNYIAIPHGAKEYKGEILKTGLCVLTYHPDPVSWGEEKVHLAIGIAAIGNDHLDILERIVDKLEEGDDVLKLVKSGDRQAIYELLTGGPS
jgi:mannitol/fructose-specific phosphotransferase system IIA component